MPDAQAAFPQRAVHTEPPRVAARDAQLLWLPNHVENRAVRWALTIGFGSSSRADYARTRHFGSTVMTVFLQSPDGARISRRAVDELVARLTPWAATAVTYIVALAHERRDRRSHMQPARVTLGEIAEGLGLAGPGRPLRPRDSDRLLDVFLLLRLLHVHGGHSVTHQTQPTFVPVNGPYVTLSGPLLTPEPPVTESTELWIAPGPWYVSFEAVENLYFAVVDRRIFLLPADEWRVTALGLHLAEVWRLRAQKGLDDLRLSLEDVMWGVSGSIDSRNARRYALRMMKRLQQLVQVDMLASLEDLPAVPAAGRQKWFAQWKREEMAILPSDRIVQALQVHLYSGRPTLDEADAVEHDASVGGELSPEVTWSPSPFTMPAPLSPVSADTPRPAA